MKYVFFGVLLLHGAIHLMGFLKAFKFAEIEQLTTGISKFSGVLWLASFVLFLLAGFFYLVKAETWFIFALVAVLLSTILIFTAWKDAKFGVIPNMIILLIAIVGYGTSNYKSWYESEVKSGLKQVSASRESILTETDIVVLPEKVQNYIRYTGSLGKPKVSNFKIAFDGKIRKNDQSGWMPFTSEQYNFMDSSTRLFFMEAVMKGIPVAGFHCFKNGVAFMDIRLLSLLKVQYQTGKEMGIAETVTFFNDMCCMAPATLIDKRIQWLEADSNRVKAAFSNNGISITAELFFNEKGELVNFISDDRYAANDDKPMLKLRWQTPMKSYKEVDGYRLATEAEAIYTYPEGDLCYGTFALRQVEYNCKK